jgi:hypothetical protein
MQASPDHIINAPRVHVKKWCKPVLKFSSPMEWPNFYRILKSKLAFVPVETFDGCACLRLCSPSGAKVVASM